MPEFKERNPNITAMDADPGVKRVAQKIFGALGGHPAITALMGEIVVLKAQLGALENRLAELESSKDQAPKKKGK